ncbi:MAG: tetratricopeptide repeat protein [Lachnospiraceae bacterium]|nr:tetratricopeptide repeat protein [Lachnospiraceae bacterium]
MKCYKCGGELSEKDFCTRCGADVGVYKKIIYASNIYYNDGLAKAGVRDLSGAIVSLKQSLKFNKNNIEARNLLGLVYYEMGEVVAALSEWVISKNLRPKKNIADDYINDLQDNPSRLDQINQTVKKYNQALAYCYNESYDLALIQLKGVLKLNPRFVQAHQLMALLHINNEDWEKARKELNRCIRVDANNTMTLRYLKEVEQQLETDEAVSGQGRKKKTIAEEAVVYQSGNETIIQPLNVKEPIRSSAFLNIMIGLLIGLGVGFFLIAPARTKQSQEDSAKEIRQISENLDAKTAEITEYVSRVKALEDENAALQDEIEGYTGADGQIHTVDSLMEVAKAYLETPEEYEKLGDMLYGVNVDYVQNEASEAYKHLYYGLMEKVGTQIAGKLYEAGVEALHQSDYTTAIEKLEKAWFFDQTNGESLYQLAQAYRMSDNEEKAKETYEKVVELFPDSTISKNAQEYLEE